MIGYTHASRTDRIADLMRANACLISTVNHLRSELEAVNRRAQISLTALQLFLGEKDKGERREAA